MICVSQRRFSWPGILSVAVATLAAAVPLLAQDAPPKVEIDWNKVVIVSRSTPTLQVVTNPMLNPGAPIHDGLFAALKALGADYVRYVPWLPYPKIAVAELDPPTKDKTSWDFTYIDPVTKDFLAATEGHSTMINFSTIPAWMFKTDQPVNYPEDPNQVFWNYTQGTELRDPERERTRRLLWPPGELVTKVDSRTRTANSTSRDTTTSFPTGKCSTRSTSSTRPRRRTTPGATTP